MCMDTSNIRKAPLNVNCFLSQFKEDTGTPLVTPALHLPVKLILYNIIYYIYGGRWSGGIFYHDNSKLRASIFAKLSL